ncbi:hypothetical protein GCM10023223_49380 [Stackebrandtia albiflava]
MVTVNVPYIYGLGWWFRSAAVGPARPGVSRRWERSAPREGVGVAYAAARGARHTFGDVPHTAT